MNISQEAQMHPLTLRFPDALETEFRARHYENSLTQIRLAYVLGFVLYGLFGILDAWIIPDASALAHRIRYAVVCPTIAVVFIWTFHQSFRWLGLCLTCAALFTVSGGILAMIAIAEPPCRDLYYAGLLIIMTYVYVLFRLRFIWATAVAWTIVVAYEIVGIWIAPTPTAILLNNNFFFLSCNIVGMFAAYMLEAYERRDFCQARLIEQQRAAIAAERERAEQMLYNILPKPIAIRLQSNVSRYPWIGPCQCR